MRAIVQRVSEASVSISGETVGSIQKGLLLLVCVEDNDLPEDNEWMAYKICNLRIMKDEDGKMNKSIHDIGGGLLVVSQFTLFASLKGGNRPYFSKAAKPAFAIPFYESFLQLLETKLGRPVEKGVFGADMQVSLVNDGPVTLILDSKVKE